MKKRIFWCSLFIIIYIFFECSSLFTFYVLRKKRYISYSPVRTESISQKHVKSLSKLLEGREEYLTYSSTLGWTIKPNENKIKYRSNSIGIRSDDEYAFMPQPNTIRISTFGDSFTHCDDVQNHETWQERLRRLHHNLEVLNFGVPAFGLDQAFLRFKHDGAAYKSHVIFIGFMSDNIFRNVNVFRPFYHANTGLPLSKPRFYIKNGKLILYKNPIRSLSQYKYLIEEPKRVLSKMGEDDYFFKVKYRKSMFDVLPSVILIKSLYYKSLPLIDKSFVIKNGVYNENSEALQVTVKIFDEFVYEVKKGNSLPIILVFPSKKDIMQYRKDRSKKYISLLNHFQNRSYNYIDIMNAFDIYNKSHSIQKLFSGGHYSPLGNELVAKYISYVLQEQHIL